MIMLLLYSYTRWDFEKIKILRSLEMNDYYCIRAFDYLMLPDDVRDLEILFIEYINELCNIGQQIVHIFTEKGKYLKEQNPNVQVVAVEPARSPLLSEGHA